MSAETCRLDNVFAPDAFVFGLYTQFISIYVPCIIDAFCTYQELAWPWRCVGWWDIVIISCLVSTVYFNCIFQLYISGFSVLLHGSRYHVTLCIGQFHPITVYRTGFGVSALLLLSVVIYSFYKSLIECFFVTMVATIIEILWSLYSLWTTHLGFLKLSNSGSAPPWLFLTLNIGLNMLLSDSLCYV